ncbi:hypothetical protein OG921_04725 [Aldersonia sp. NBC_00410]|uniref:hypothetical protein n=1 Tax=Aldersonia sp. NBC_00410 TaxID=2975954 RepID=UPI00225A5A5B|nr:hypothetical protein [Aldersonia sp. NBC_00410]MCX5042476.1 hypothetical protein [Aldersonia sp. NBC_00410]
MIRALRVVQGRTVETDAAPTDPVLFQLDCVEAFVTSRVVRGFSAVTIENETGVLGSSNRTHRNALVYLAADEARLVEELDNSTRDYLGWTHV